MAKILASIAGENVNQIVQQLSQIPDSGAKIEINQHEHTKIEEYYDQNSENEEDKKQEDGKEEDKCSDDDDLD